VLRAERANVNRFNGFRPAVCATLDKAAMRPSTTLPIRAAKQQGRFEGSFGVIRRHSSMTNDHFSILNSQFTRKNRRLNPLLQSQPSRCEPNLNCCQKCT
jgi:hypothetical protein